MKLVSSKKKKQNTIIAIAVALVAVIAVVGIIIGVSNVFNVGPSTTSSEPPLTMRGISVSKLPDKWEYTVGDEFDPRGTKIQVVMNQQYATYFVEYTELEFSGFDSSVPNDDLVITVSYRGYTTTFSVVVKEAPSAPVELVGIKLSDNFKTTYTLAEWKSGPNFNGVSLVLMYSDGSTFDITKNIQKYCSGFDTTITEPGETQFYVRYKGFEYIAKITITE